MSQKETATLAGGGFDWPLPGWMDQNDLLKFTKNVRPR